MGRRGWRLWAVFLASALMLLVGAVDGSGAIQVTDSGTTTISLPGPVPTSTTSFGEVGTLQPNSISPAFSVGGEWCKLGFGVATLGILTRACSTFQQEEDQLYTATEQAAMHDLIIATENDLNITAAQASLYNASVQELSSYFAQRAEALVPYFLNQSWSNVLADEIATYSGLTLSLEGILTALGEQEYQVWNATIQSFQGVFGLGEIYGSTGNAYNVLEGAPSHTNPYQMVGGGGSVFLIGGETSNLYQNPNGAWSWNATPSGKYWSDYTISLPWEFWSGYPDAVAQNTGSPTIYFSMEPGGTVVDAELAQRTGDWWGNWTLTDVTTGQTVPVPTVSYAQWRNQTGPSSIPILTKEYPFGPFDLFKATCSSGCGQGLDPQDSWLETSGAYAYENGSTGYAADTYLDNAMVPHVLVGQTGYTGISGGANFSTFLSTPSTFTGICGVFTTNILSGNCSTPTAPTEGFASEISGGPGQVVGGNDTLTQLGPTFQHVLNNTMALVHAEYNVLRAVTDNGTYQIPADCSMPFPSDAFPAATDPANYQLSVANTEVVYLAYLEATARWYGTQLNGNLGFCDNPDLGLRYNWTSTWSLRTNITASIYLGSSTGAVYANGTPDPTASLSSPSSWPIRNVDPTLLYPFEYQLTPTVGQVVPLPFNDPTAAVLVNWSGNPEYGASGFLRPSWGIPSYDSLTGHGNAVDVSGYVSGTSSNEPNSTGDALYISSCVVGGVSQSTCPLSVVYFNNFTFGVVHSFVAVSCQVAGTCPGSGGGGGGGGLASVTDCGFGTFGSWYDAWIGYVGEGVSSFFGYAASAVGGIPIIGGAIASFLNGIGCVLAWVVVIIVIVIVAVLLLYIAWKGVEFVRG